MILEGHLGAHLGTAMPAFLAKEVAPWLKSDAEARVARKPRKADKKSTMPVVAGPRD
jgi:hypothetical protein